MSRGVILLFTLLASFSAVAETFEAQVQWNRRVELAIPVSGVVGRVDVHAGDQVKSGQLLIALAPERFKAQVAQAQAREKEARHHKAEADRELERALELYDRTVLSDHDKQMAEIEAARANAAWHQARAAVTEASLDLEQSRILAPFDGYVVKLMTQPGEVVVSALQANPLVVVAGADGLIARARLTAQQVAGLSLGQAVEVGVAGHWMDARISYLGLEPVAYADKSPLYEIDALFQRNEHIPLRVGGDALIRIE